MKRGYSKALYDQRNKDETIISVIKRLFGGHQYQTGQNIKQGVVISMYRLEHTQITNLAIIVMISIALETKKE